MEPSQDPPKKLTVKEKQKLLLKLLKKGGLLDKLKTWPPGSSFEVQMDADGTPPYLLPRTEWDRLYGCYWAHDIVIGHRAFQVAIPVHSSPSG